MEEYLDRVQAATVSIRLASADYIAAVLADVGT